MMPEELKNLFEAIQSIATTLALIIGGFWAYTKFVRQREGAPKIRFDIDITFVSKIGDNWIAELTASIENKGLVQHKIDASTFTFNLRACLKNKV